MDNEENITNEINDIQDDDIFISRYNYQQKEIYSKEKYLTALMRFSIFERILTKYLFQDTSQDFTLYPFLEDVQSDSNRTDLLKKRMGFCSQNYDKEHPLYFFSQISKEILRLLKEDDLSLMKFDKYILKIEFLLAWHFENNFFPSHLEQKMNIDFYDNLILQIGKTNYVYSVECLNTIEQFLKVFERQNLSTRIENEFPLIRNLFCSEKIYYFYCDKLQREKLPSGNIIKYLLDQIKLKLKDFTNSKVKNYDMENYFMMNFYIINRIIQNFPFYLYKKPELLEIYNCLKPLRNWPYPVGTTCSNIMENIINECTFQGITLLNKIREIYFIDSLDKDINVIETKYFRGILVLYSSEWEVRHGNSMKSEAASAFNIIKFYNRLKTKEKKDHNKNMLIRELIIKLFITILFNSKENFTDDTFKNIYLKFLPKYKTLYINENTKNNEEEDEKMEEEEEDNLNINMEQEGAKHNKNQIKNKNDVFNQSYGIIKPSLDKLLKIVDVGMDKIIEDFNKELNIIAKKLVGIKAGGKSQNEDEEETILDSKAYLPISSFRSYLKPIYVDLKKLYKSADESNTFDLFDYYLKTFVYVVENYFPYFLGETGNTEVDNNIRTLRKNFFNNFRLNLLIVEEEGVINDLLDTIQNKIIKQLNKKISNDSFNKFWSYFVDKRTEVIPKYIFYIVPNYDKPEMNPFRILAPNDNIENDPTYLSEFIASVDNIYKNIIFLPFASSCDNVFYNYILNCQLNNKNVMKFPSLDIMYSFLKKPLDYYIGDSNGIFNLDIYQISINDSSKYKKLFWKNVEIILTESKPCKISLLLVDMLGLQSENVIEFTLEGNFMIKIFNIFFRKNVPFNYNMSSNNGWLELFLNDKFNKAEVEKFCNYSSFIKLNNETKYYEEFNMPKTEIENRFKNYKIVKLFIETNSPNLIIKYDDNYNFEYKDKFELKKVKKDLFQINIAIEPFMLGTNNNINYKLPVATFTTI